MIYDGVYPYLEPTDQLHDVPAWSQELADILAVPAVGEGGVDTSFALSAGVTSWTMIGGIATTGRILTRRTLCLALASMYVSGTANAFHKCRLRVTGGDGTIHTSERNRDHALWKAVDSDYRSLAQTFVLNPGSTGVAARLEYQTPTGTTASMAYVRVDLIPIRVY